MFFVLFYVLFVLFHVFCHVVRFCPTLVFALFYVSVAMFYVFELFYIFLAMFFLFYFTFFVLFFVFDIGLQGAKKEPESLIPRNIFFKFLAFCFVIYQN